MFNAKRPALLLLIAALMLTACGRKGALFMAPPKPQPAVNTSAEKEPVTNPSLKTQPESGK